MTDILIHSLVTGVCVTILSTFCVVPIAYIVAIELTSYTFSVNIALHLQEFDVNCVDNVFP